MFKVFSVLIAFSATFVVAYDRSDIVTNNKDIDSWLSTSKAEMTYLGNETFNPLATTVIFCSSWIGNVCGGQCSTYNGGATCINAPDTACFWASRNVGYCDRSLCLGDCTDYESCPQKIEGGFCAAPGTGSIAVGFAISE